MAAFNNVTLTTTEWVNLNTLSGATAGTSNEETPRLRGFIWMKENGRTNCCRSIQNTRKQS
jgi:hypothetical protein